MSSANAAAKKRRAPTSSEPIPTRPGTPSAQTGPNPNISNTGLTLPQVISLVDRRLTTLETFMNTTTANNTSAGTVSASKEVDSEQLEDFNSRFDVLAEEIANMKNIVLSLQSYTMDINKVLMEERIRILSEVNSEEEKDTELAANQSNDLVTKA